MKTLTPVKRKMFSINTLGTKSKVIGIKSWLEDTLNRKMKRKEEGRVNLRHNRMTFVKKC